MTIKFICNVYAIAPSLPVLSVYSIKSNEMQNVPHLAVSTVTFIEKFSTGVACVEKFSPRNEYIRGSRNPKFINTPQATRARRARTLTFLEDVDARMVEEEVLEAVALRIDMRLPAEARRSEEVESLQRAQGRLTLSHRHRRASHCNRGNDY